MNKIEPQHSIPSADDESHVRTVLQILPSLNGGGVERGTIEIAAALKSEGWIPIVVSSGGIMEHELTRMGVRHITLPVASKNPLVMRRNVARLREIIKQHNVDIVHARSRAPAWSAMKAARKEKCHFVTTFHAAYTRGGFLKNYYNSVMAKGEKVIAISDFIARHIREKYEVTENQIVTIPRGVDCRKFNPAAISAERIIKLASDWQLPDGVPVIMLPGRLTRLKGHTAFIEALAKLKNDNFLALMVGSTDGREAYYEEISNLIRSRNLEGRVQIKGHCDDMAVALMLSDVVVSATTVPEGFGRVAVEAQAMGRPVVATAHGGSMETILDGETGWLIPVDDSDAIAAALNAAISMTTDQREAVATLARQHVMEKFDIETMCSATLKVYTDLLSN